jgi:uncharacterized protein (TIGR00290 family)
MAEKIVLSWSGGKDSALTLERLLYHGAYTVEGLFTVYDRDTQKVKLHNVPIQLIRLQAKSINLPLFEIPIEENASNEKYEEAHINLFNELKKNDIHHAAFGDLFLEVIRNYRESLAEKAGFKFHYPLWKENPEKLSSEFIERGFKAVVTAINSDVLDEDCLGKQYDENFISSLPDNVDICGENGEFHTFVWDGPYFSKPVGYVLGENSTKDYRPEIDMSMSFCEIMPV